MDKTIYKNGNIVYKLYKLKSIWAANKYFLLKKLKFFFKVKKQIIGVQVIKLFYAIYSFKQLSKIAKKAKNQKGTFEHNFLSLIEAKLPSFLYRTSIFATIFDSIKFVKGCNVWINKKFKS